MSLVNINSQSLWRLHQYFKPHIKHWDEDYVLFDEVSGDTHILDPLAGFVLGKLTNSPACIDALYIQIPVDDKYSVDELKSLISDVLFELAQLDFVEEVPA